MANKSTVHSFFHALSQIFLLRFFLHLFSPKKYSYWSLMSKGILKKLPSYGKPGFILCTYILWQGKKKQGGEKSQPLQTKTVCRTCYCMIGVYLPIKFSGLKGLDARLKRGTAKLDLSEGHWHQHYKFPWHLKEHLGKQADHSSI